MYESNDSLLFELSIGSTFILLISLYLMFRTHLNNFYNRENIIWLNSINKIEKSPTTYSDWANHSIDLVDKNEEKLKIIESLKTALKLTSSPFQVQKQYQKIASIYEEIWLDQYSWWKSDIYRLNAIEYYKKCNTTHNCDIRRKALMLEHHKLGTNDWLERAKNSKNTVEISDACEIAVEYSQKSVETLYQAGLIIKENLSKINSKQALEYFKAAADSGHIPSAKEYVRLYYRSISLEEYFKIGAKYLLDSRPLLAYSCFEVAKSLPDAAYAMAVMLRDGIGVKTDKISAMQLFDSASKKDHTMAKIAYMMCKHDHLKTAEEWNLLGNDYYAGKNGYNNDYLLAEACYRRALEINPTFSSPYYNIALLHECGYGVAVNYDIAIFYFSLSKNFGNKNAEGKIKKIKNSKYYAPLWRTLEFSTGVLEIGVGVIGIFSSFGILGGSVISMGCNSIEHSIMARDEELLSGQYFIQSISSGVSGAVSSAVMLGLSPWVKSETRYLSFLSEGTEKTTRIVAVAGISGASSYLTNHAVKNLLQRRAILSTITKKDLLISWATGMSGGLLNVATSPLLQSFYDGVFEAAIDESSRKLYMIFAGGIAGGATGAIGATTTIVLSNAIRKLSNENVGWFEGFGEALLLGIINSSILSAFSAVEEYEIRERRSAVEKILKEVEENQKILSEILTGPEAEKAKQLNELLLKFRIDVESKLKSELMWAIENKCKFVSGYNVGQFIRPEDISNVLDLLSKGSEIKLTKYGKHHKKEAKITLYHDFYEKKTKVKGHDRKAKLTLYDKSVYEKLERETNDANRALSKILKEHNFDGDEIIQMALSERERLVENNRKYNESNCKITNYKGVKSSLITDLPMQEDFVPNFRDTNVTWDTIEKAMECSSASYDNKTGGQVTSLKIIGHIERPDYGFDSFVYADQEKNTIYIAFKGSQKASQWFIDDPGLALTGKPLSANRHIKAEIENICNAYPNSKIILTGHSLGAAIATWYSMQLGIDALCFDNPGCCYKGDYSKVISFQSMPNIVNRLNPSKGNIMQLATPTSTYTKLCNFFGGSTNVISEGLGLYSHKLDFIKRSLNRTRRLSEGESNNRALIDYIRKGSQFTYNTEFANTIFNQINEASSKSTTSYFFYK